MLQIFECSIRALRFTPTGDKLVSSMRVEGALSQDLARELGNGELYLKKGVLTEFTSHGFSHDLDAARGWFFPMPGTPGENDALLHIHSCAVKGFSATRLPGSGATIELVITTDVDAVALTEFLCTVRGWSGRLDIEELQQELHLDSATDVGFCQNKKEDCNHPAEDHLGMINECGATGCECQKFKAPSAKIAGLPTPLKKRGRGAQPPKPSEEATGSEVVHALHSGEVDVKATKSGKAKLVPRTPKSGKKGPKGVSKPRR